ncbi:MAG: S9 family peptidase [Ignavibacteriaceae bacterium]|nr:S9 family peptidase [Ignavibacteriaceae bacterium]
MQILTLLLLFLFSTLNFTQEIKTLTPELLWSVKRIGGLEVNKYGTEAVYTLSTFDLKKNEGETDFYLLDLEKGESFRFSTTKGSEGSPKFSPDGSKIAFIARRGDDERAQIYTINRNGGEAVRVTEMPAGVTSFKWMNSGEGIVFTSSVLPGTESNLDSLKSALKAMKDSKMSAKVTEDRFYRYWDKWLTDGMISHLFKLDLKDNTVTPLTPGLTSLLSVTASGGDFDISQDDQTIAVSINIVEPPYFQELNFDLFLLKTDGSGEMRNITQGNRGNDGSPLFSSNGKELFYLRTTDPSKIAENNKVVIYDLATGNATSISDKHDVSCGTLTESPDGSGFLFTSDYKGRVAVFHLAKDGSKLDVIYNDGTNSSLNIASKGLVFLNQKSTNPQRIVMLSEIDQPIKVLADPNGDLLKDITFGKYEEHYFKGADNNQVQVITILPPGFDASKKYGMIHLIHGGPHGAFSDDFHFRWNSQMFAAMGYVVAMVNFHGSTGFGEKFAQSILGAHGDKPFTDIMKATDHLLDEYDFIDKNRLAAAGGSYGGYLVNWIAGNTKRFKCLISHAGVYNLYGQFASDMTHFREIAYAGSPWGEKKNLDKYSPHMYAENFVTPMLVIHGELDYRVVVTQGLELYGVLKGKGVPARLLYYPDENHWIMKPQNSVNWYKEVNSWLDRWLK